ncbi:hypothetical protein Y032_0293g1615 [Ancylostoma ceylanicum]|uniref:Uncharacterized protein n=1 Tax=Ancylostoma ceylanicum TaxID=53326 RepID=A0A016S5R3_9BILA|nr:hypothetical protein Y032_0293g1615 [Ancylostoma ceylanicum]
MQALSLERSAIELVFIVLESPDAPVNRVTVTSDLVLPESPSPISPPNQIEEIRRVAISPPLHSKKMAEHENPFRPEEVLYHEVDPIVEQYMHKPFPPSRPGSAHNTPTKQQKESSLSSPAYLQNGLSKEQLMDNEKAQTQPLLDEDQRQSSPEKNASNAAEFDDLPPAGKVELVHVKKRKCGCCTVQ